MDARARLEKIQRAVLDACKTAGRDPKSVRLLAVGKTKPWKAILEVAEAGQIDFGENYMQEALEKIAAAKAWAGEDAQKQKLVAGMRWHFIGHLQSNKAKLIPGNFALLHSLASLSAAEALDKAASKSGEKISALVEVNVDNEASKAGISPEALPDFLQKCAGFECVQIVGFMCIPDPEKNKGDARRPFRFLHELRDRMEKSRIYPHPLPELSMGMSADFREAIQEGSTIVRVGTAIFGERAKK